MITLWLNLRIWVYHIQAGRQEWWRLEVMKNDFHRGNKETPFVELYELSKPRSFIGGMTASAE